ncbi:MAG: PKD domain-containing protein [Flavobacteriales bacterium]|nr:PKD domain-containing protein [Flavobacteriales bacterium]
MRTFHGISVAFLLLLSSGLAAQRMDWVYYTSTHGSNLRSFTKVDSEGATITAVEYSSTITVGGTTFGSGGADDILLIKVLSTGEVAWAKHFGSTSDQFIGALAVDDEDRIYLRIQVSGFNTTFMADDTLLTLPSTGDRSILVRVSSDGDVDRARVGGVGYTMDTAGNDLYTVLSSTPGSAVLQRWNSDLELLSTLELGTFEASHMIIDVNPDGYIAIAGSEYTADVMEFQGTPVPNDPTDQNEGIVMLLDLEGDLQWVRSFGGMNPTTERVRGLAVANDGRVFVATASDTAFSFAGGDFPALPPYNTNVGFMLAFSATGDEDFAVPAYSLYDQVTFWDVMVDADGNTLATADIISSGVVNGIQIPACARPYTLLKLDPLGNMVWLKHPPAGSNNMSSAAFDIGQGPDGAYYLGGFGQWFRVDCTPTQTPGWRYFTMRIVEEDPLFPDASFTWSPQDGGVQFVNTSANATNASWSFGDGGASTELDPLHSYGSPGTFEVVLTASNGACVDRDTVEVNMIATGLEDDGPAGPTFSMYPNPGVDEVLIKADEVIQAFRLFDVTGRTLTAPTTGVPSRTVRLDVSELTTGRYLLECTTAAGPTVLKLHVR